ncbi:hypothetical protein [Pseudoduganella chitinolytica]|uniref:AlgX/AlgJ SGNH hydrolase-like domain-containing protein n=1 Tax=Pseudoduganella chitinolytica TaxID=34070 RepID=A0ABY8BJV0_9BURK|nr:hypothetical protein [Pseudoduganella chitinolytica]WEF35688.1 hypothetical protein PX653_13360 [Pseudoduganella chitinolytica]
MRFLLSVPGGILLAALALELALQYLPVNSGVRMAHTSAAVPYPHNRPGQPYTYSHGWAMANAQHGTTSRDGFVHSRDIGGGANVLVTGDSFIESYMLAYGDTVQGLLDAALGKVYAVASSGNGLADALVLARQFVPRTGAKAMVIFVEPFDLRTIDSPAGRGHNYFAFTGGEISVAHNPYVESVLKEQVLRSALLRYAYYNLKVPGWMEGLRRRARQGGDSGADGDLRQRRRDAALDYFLAGLAPLQRRFGTRFIFLVDGDRDAIYSDGRSSVWVGNDRATLIERVRAAGYDVVDMQPVFEQHWRTYRERLDFLPMDGHWNRVAHALAAARVLPLVTR